MKHIDKTVTSHMETTQAENMQAAWADAWSQQLSHSGEIYGRLFAGMRDEAATFVQKRLDANMETARAWSACRNVNEAVELQQNWLRCAIEHYSDQGSRMSELCRSAVFRAEPEPARHAPEEPKATPERKPARETHPHIRHAAE
jgi:hypothetical protein